MLVRAWGLGYNLVFGVAEFSGGCGEIVGYHAGV